MYNELKLQRFHPHVLQKHRFKPHVNWKVFLFGFGAEQHSEINHTPLLTLK